MKKIESKESLLQMKKMIARLRLKLEVLADNVDKSLKKRTHVQKKFKK